MVSLEDISDEFVDIYKFFFADNWPEDDPRINDLGEEAQK